MLRSLPPANLDVLLNAVRRKGKPVSFRKRQVIFSAGEPADSAYFIEEGLVKVCITSAQGREAIVSVLGKGHFLGQECLHPSQGLDRESGAVALTNVRAQRIERRAMLQLLRDDRDVSEMFIFYLIGVGEQLNKKVAEGLLYGSEERLARALLSMEQFRGTDKNRLPRGLSQFEVASMIGATRQRVNALMQQFKKLGVIDSQGAAIRDSVQQIIAQGGATRASRSGSRPQKPGAA